MSDYWIRHGGSDEFVLDAAPDGSGKTWYLSQYPYTYTTYSLNGGPIINTSTHYGLKLRSATGDLEKTTFYSNSTGVRPGDRAHSLCLNGTSPVACFAAAVTESSSAPITIAETYDIVKFDSGGAQQWRARLRDANSRYYTYGSRYNFDHAYSAIAAAGAHLYVAAAMPYKQTIGYASNGVEYADYVYLGLFKLSAANGAIVWQRKVIPTLPTYDAIIPSGIAAVSGGNIYVAATARLSGVAVTQLVLKYNSSGTLQWQKKITTIGANASLGVAIDASENIYTAYVEPDTSAIHVHKMDTDGNAVWAKVFTFSGALVEASGGIAWDATNSKVYVTATIDSDHYVLQLSSSGTLNWTRKIYRTSGGRDTAGKVVTDAANGVFLLTGTSV